MADISGKEFPIPPEPDERKAAINKVLEGALLRAKDNRQFRPWLVDALNKVKETGDFIRDDGVDSAVDANGVLAVARALTSDKPGSFYIVGEPSAWTVETIIKLVGGDPEKIDSKTRTRTTIKDFKGQEFADETVYKLPNGINLVKLVDKGKVVGGVSLYAEKPEPSSSASKTA